jgi:type IV pilus assembly protein PilF
MHTQKLIIVFVSILCLSACITTVDGVQVREVDQNKVLSNEIQLGMAYLGKGDREGAQIHFEKALKIDKKSHQAINGMGLVYQYEGESELAEEYFKRSLKLRPDFAQGHNNYGSFLYSKKRFEEAYEEFNTAASVINYRGRAGALTNLGRTALMLDRPEKAEASFEHAVKLNPRESLALIELAEMLFTQEDYSASKKYLDQYDRVARQSARSLWLGIQIERIFGNNDKEASYALALKNLHPYSKEYLNYKKSL